MIETVVFALFCLRCKLYIQFGKFKIHKDSYFIKPILKRWSIYPIIFMELVYLYLQSTIMMHNYYFVQYQHLFKSMLLISFIILGIDTLFRYKQYKQYLIAICTLLGGFSLNYIVMYFNNNKMPIFPTISFSTGYSQPDMIINASKYGDYHVFGSHATNLIFLSDIFDMGTSIWSIGDVLIRISAFIIIYYSIKQMNINNNIS